MPFLKEIAPEAEIIAAPQVASGLEDKSILESLYEENLDCAKALNKELSIDKKTWCEAFKVSRVLGDGDTISLGLDVEVKLISTPGHSEDSTAFYVIPDAVLTGGETLGFYQGRDKVTSAFSSSYQDYLSSIDKLLNLDIKTLILPHCGALTGELAKKYLGDLRTQSERFFESTKALLDEGKIIEEIVDELIPEWETNNISPEGPFRERQRSCLTEMVQAVADCREGLK